MGCLSWSRARRRGRAKRGMGSADRSTRGATSPFGVAARQPTQTGGVDPARGDLAMNSKNTICLWYDSAALEAATFYAETFPDSAVLAVHRALPAREGDVLTVEFRVMGIPCPGSTAARPSATAKRSLPGRHRRPGRDRPPVERYRRQWRRGKRLRPVTSGASPGRSPRAYSAKPSPAPTARAARRAFEAMMTMGRIDIATIEKAFKG